MVVHIRTRRDVDSVIDALATKLPVELVLDIVELADYRPYLILGSREEESDVHCEGGDTTSKTYLVVQIPFLNHHDIDEEGCQGAEIGAQQAVGIQPNKHRKRVVQKIVFRTTSHDQGWGGEHGCAGTYMGAYSWIGAEIWRKKTENYQDDMKAALATQAKIVLANGGDITNEGAYHHWCFHHGYTKIGMEEDEDETEGVRRYGENFDYGDDYLEDDWEESEQESEEVQEVEEWKSMIIRKAKEDYYKVGTWVVQRNITAGRESKDHEIVWDATVDGPGPDTDKWGYDYRDENGRMIETGWVDNGNVSNSTFVKELREGDEVRVMMRARFPGWSCTIEKCEVECWWAL